MANILSPELDLEMVVFDGSLWSMKPGESTENRLREKFLVDGDGYITMDMVVCEGGW